MAEKETKKTRTRTVLNARQHHLLQKHFRLCAFPDAAQRVALSALVGMKVRAVQIWFQNQRQKFRNLYEATNNASGYAKLLLKARRDTGSSKSLIALASLACEEYYKRNG